MTDTRPEDREPRTPDQLTSLLDELVDAGYLSIDSRGVAVITAGGADYLARALSDD